MQVGDGNQELKRIEKLGERPDLWGSIDVEDLELLMYRECIHYGARGDETWIPKLMALYKVVVERLPVNRRQSIVEMVATSVEEGDGLNQKSSGIGWGNALLPFIFEDPDVSVVSTASLEVAQLMRTKDDDELTGPRTVRGWVEDEHLDEERRVGILTGLLLLGDRRTLPLLQGCWRLLTQEACTKLTHAYSGFTYASLVDFYLDWYEDASEVACGAIAAALVRLPRDAKHPMVIDVERRLGSLPKGQARIRSLREWTFQEYGCVIEPRLRDLLRRENDPQLLPHVLCAWGLEL